MGKRPCAMHHRPGVTILRPVYIHDSALIGPGTKIAKFVDIGKDVVIGVDCNIQAHVSISNYCSVGRQVFIGPGARLLNDKYMDGKIEPVIVEDHVRIGGGAVILPGVRLGRRCLIGAGAVVTKNVPPNTIAYGNPAKLRGLIESR